MQQILGQLSGARGPGVSVHLGAGFAAAHYRQRRQHHQAVECQGMNIEDLMDLQGCVPLLLLIIFVFLQTQRLVTDLPGHEGSVFAVDWAPNGWVR